jgi:hypothetical protein
MENMKTLIRIPLTLTCAVVLLLSVSCSTTKQSADRQPKDISESVLLPSGSGNDTVIVPAERKTVPLVPGAEPVEIGKSSMFEYNFLNTDVDIVGITYYYYPSSGEICIQGDSSSLKTYILFDQSMRAICRQAISRYEKDFADHVLNEKYRGAYKIYGEAKGHYKWGLLGGGNETRPQTSVGYVFVKGSPYFTLTMWPADGVYRNVEEREIVANSEKMTFLMNKKQIADMALFMDEQKIVQIVEGLQKTVPKGDMY